ncbi:nucleotidyl transferase AbiEii/AbiGii toxin family protein [Corynebacterium kozikiae]|uniref:nucleotidyl transferase AbiEii/AbiGii toxin family protein n=1 Tax=Corynebacterium kozikiae TaxID=2968469 RepID=UPI00359C6EEE
MAKKRDAFDDHLLLRNWQRSVAHRVADLAHKQGRAKGSIQFQLVFECFLSRIFAEPSTDWVLKGGTALLMRNGSGRFTKDIVLAHGAIWGGVEEIAFELRSLNETRGKRSFPVSSNRREFSGLGC